MKISEALDFLQFGDWYNNMIGISDGEKAKLGYAIAEVCDTLRYMLEDKR